MKIMLAVGRTVVCLFVLSVPTFAGIIDNPGSPTPPPPAPPAPTQEAPSEGAVNTEEVSLADASAEVLVAAWLAVQSILP